MVAYGATDRVRTIVLHCFEGADETELKEQARATRIAPTVMEVVTMRGPERTRGRAHLVR